MKSIRQYLQTRIIGGASVILAAGSLLLGLAIRHLDIHEFDVDLETKARMLATLVLHDGIRIEADFSAQLLPEFVAPDNAEYFQFRFENGSTIRRSALLGSRDLPFLPEAAENPVLMNLRLPDGRRGRFIQLAFRPRTAGTDQPIREETGVRIPDGMDSTMVVLGLARSREGLDAFLLSVYSALAMMNMLLIALIVLLVHRALNRAFQPVSRLNAQIAALKPDTLTKRIHLLDAPAEIASVPSTLNEFMAALQAAFARERRFTSDAAHELRTPVAEFRAACEVGAKWSDDSALVRRRFENLQASAVNMERMLNHLLDISKLERGATEIHRTEICLASLVDSCWARVSDDGVMTGHRLENRIAPPLTLHTDAVKLEMILCNLLNNAASHSPPDSVVICDCIQSSEGAWEMRISNPAPGMRPEDLPHVFDRFWRKDAARTGGRHVGLGLSIVKALADALDLRITVELTPDNLFTARLASF